jgi:hypothetical protein
MTESNEKEMKEKVRFHCLSIFDLGVDRIPDREKINSEINEIITLCRTHFGRVWWEEIEKIKLRMCHDPKHDYRWCKTCDGREEVIGELKQLLGDEDGDEIKKTADGD